LQQMENPIIQEYIDAPEYTVDVFADFEGNVISVVPRERIKVLAGESFVSRTSRNFTMINEASRLATALRLVGHNTVQCFLLGNLVQFIEVNPRFGGAAHLGFAAGVPTPRLLVRIVKGEKLTPILGQFRDNYYMLRYTEDLYMDQDKLAWVPENERRRF